MDYLGAGFELHTLRTRDGAPVIDVWLPPFRPLPEILWWGSRFFFYRDGAYREGLCFYVAPMLEAR